MQEQLWREQAAAASVVQQRHRQLVKHEPQCGGGILALPSSDIHQNPSLAQVMMHQRERQNERLRLERQDEGNTNNEHLEQQKIIRNVIARQKSGRATRARRASATDLEEQLQALRIKERIDVMNNRRSSDPERSCKDVVQVPRQEQHRRFSLQDPSSMTIKVDRTMEPPNVPERPQPSGRSFVGNSGMPDHHHTFEEEQSMMDSYDHSCRRRGSTRGSIPGGPGPVPYCPTPSERHQQPGMMLDNNDPTIRRSRRGSMNAAFSGASRRGSLQTPLPPSSGGTVATSKSARRRASDSNVGETQRAYLDSLFPRVQVGPKKQETKKMVNRSVDVNPDVGKKKTSLIETMRSKYISPFD
mmetsp:Transcript_26254/g.40262  ORF Transcript_26254/g.40262 Transcript_26254/m.40262 type:complete len:357 (+) Transcript_26254:147-1217(+)